MKNRVEPADQGGTDQPVLNLRGVLVHQGFLRPEAQLAMLGAIRAVAAAAPLRHYATPMGRPMSVRMTAAGALGWVSDTQGYRYAERHRSGGAWPAIPPEVLAVWHAVTGLARVPDSCLVNYYDAAAKMGLHRDDTEADHSWPVVSISLGDDALFRVGGPARGGSTESLWLRSGDVLVLGGAARLIYHGVDRIRFGSSALLPQGGRINLTLRVAG